MKLIKMDIDILTLLENHTLPYFRSNYPNINRGGCGLFAKVLSDFLKKNSIDHDIVRLSYCSEKHKEIIHNISQRNTNYDKLSDLHFVVKLDETYVDAHDTGTFHNYSAELTHTNEDINFIVKHSHRWNDAVNQDFLLPYKWYKLLRIRILFNHIFHTFKNLYIVQ